MKKQPSFQSFKRYHNSMREFVPEVAEAKLRFVEMFGFYDGPLDGIVEYEEKKYRYEVVSDFVNQRRRYFALLELTDTEYQNEMNWHLRFKEYISLGEKANHLQWEDDSKVYKKLCKNNYRDKEVSAWFCMY